MMAFNISIISGLAFGIEQDTGEEDDDYKWLVAIHFGILRFILLSLKET